MTQKDGDLSVRDEDIQIPSFDTVKKEISFKILIQ